MIVPSVISLSKTPHLVTPDGHLEYEPCRNPSKLVLGVAKTKTSGKICGLNTEHGIQRSVLRGFEKLTSRLATEVVANSWSLTAQATELVATAGRPVSVIDAGAGLVSIWNTIRPMRFFRLWTCQPKSSSATLEGLQLVSSGEYILIKGFVRLLPLPQKRSGVRLMSTDSVIHGKPGYRFSVGEGDSLREYNLRLYDELGFAFESGQSVRTFAEDIYNRSVFWDLPGCRLASQHVAVQASCSAREGEVRWQ